MKIKITPIDLIETLFVWVLILDCRSVYTSTVPGFKSFVMYLAIILMLLLIISNSVLNARRVQHGLIAVVGMTIYLIVYALVTDSNMLDFLKIFCVFIVMFAFYSLYCDVNILQRLINKYISSITIIAAFSICMWLMISCFGLLSPTNLLHSSWTGGYIRNYGYVFFEVQEGTSLMDLLGIHGYRNTAIFNEAPMYSFHLILAIILNEFCVEKKRKKATYILAFALLTSFSSTGYIAMVAVVFLKYVKSKNTNNLAAFMKMAIIPIMLFLAYEVVSMLVLNKMDSKSGLIRLDDIQAWTRLWMDYPIFGAGYGTQEYINYLASWRFGTGVSNSIGMILGYGGVWLMTLYVLPIIRTVYFAIKNHNIDLICFVLVFGFVFTVTVVPFQYLTFFVFLAMSDAFKRYEKTSGVYIRNNEPKRRSI